MSTLTLKAFGDLLARYAQVAKAAWAIRADITPKERTSLERQFLPAALEIIDTPAPALARAVVFTIVTVFLLALIWATFGKIDQVAVAPGKIISADKAKTIQASETGVVKRIHVKDGQAVKAGDVLIELEAAATATAAETSRIRDALGAARLESARHEALALAASGVSPLASFKAPADAPQSLVQAEARSMHSQYQEHRAKLSALDAEHVKRSAELASAKELVNKLAQTAPMAKRRADDYKDLVDKNFVSNHGYLDKEQIRIEQERDLAYQQAKVRELTAAAEEVTRRRFSLAAEFERIAVGNKTDADKKAAQLEQELIKADTREKQQVLRAPVDGTVQQLAMNTIGGVAQAAQALMVIAPRDYSAEVEVVLENKDVGFVKTGQTVEVKVETFPFTRYGTLTGTVSFVSNDAVNDEKKGPVFQARIKLDKAVLRVDERDVNMTPGMAVSAEIATGRRRAIEYFLDPIKKTTSEGLRER
jgi:hemolysin D